MKKWLALAVAIALEVTASLSLKGALTTPALYVLVVAGYAGSFYALFLSLRSGMPLGVGYGIWGASGVALTALMSALLFAEPVTLIMTIGIALVMAGVLTVEFGSQAAAKRETEAAQ